MNKDYALHIMYAAVTVLYIDLATWTTNTAVRTVHSPRQLIPGS